MSGKFRPRLHRGPEIVHWNPRRRDRLGTGRFSRSIPWMKRVDNFGDLLGPVIVNRIVEHRKLVSSRRPDARLLAVGSIMRLARDGDVVWGTGVNGKTIWKGPFPDVDVRAVRGPKTASVLRNQGLEVPDVYGDPALLIPTLWSDNELGIQRGGEGVLYAPNLNDYSSAPKGSLDPRGEPWRKIRRIARADLVIASSLHAIIVAESYGVPVVVVQSQHEPLFKYQDYFLGTGRELPIVARDWHGAELCQHAPPLEWSPDELLESFPIDLWSAS